MIRSILVAVAGLTLANAQAQTIIDFGSATDTNAVNTYPAPYGNQALGARHQMIFLASELATAGFQPGGSVSACGFNVADTSGSTFSGFTISMGHTTQGEFVPAPPVPAFITGTAPVWGPYDHHDTLGWNMHTLDVPFIWDGVSNVVVEACFLNTSASQNARMCRTDPGFVSTIYRATANINVCTGSGNQQVSALRPDMRFVYNPPMIPPVAAFTADATYSCDATIAFTDQSQYAPTWWSWDFGDGGIDSVQDPEHTFPGDGTFVVTLIDSNAYGTDTAYLTVTINGAGVLPPASCTPFAFDTLAGIGLAEVAYLGVLYGSADAATEAYQDRSCVNDTAEVGDTFTLSLMASSTLAHNLAAWIDWNNDGAFDPAEQVLNGAGISASGPVTVPATATTGIPLRVRIVADDASGPALDPCNDPLYGQAEDYALVVLPNDDLPVAAFTQDVTTTCDGVVIFTDLSTESPDQWAWDFGDGSAVDTTQNPAHTYTIAGTYTVSLIATNAVGSDTLTLIDLITVAGAGSCDTINVPDPAAGGTDLLITECFGTLADDGGPYADYTPGTSAAVTIAPAGAASVTLTFSQFEFDPGGAGDFLTIYDGPDIGSPLIGSWTGSGVGVLPGGGVISSTGASITIQQQCTPGVVVDQGFLLTWQCTPDTVPPAAAFSASATFSCDPTIAFFDESGANATSWNWDFGDGSPADTTQNPVHTYLIDGTFLVTLTAGNMYGSTTATLAITINANGASPAPACTPLATDTVAGIGIASVTYGAIANTTLDAASEGYLDATCLNDTFLVCTEMVLTVNAVASGFQHNLAAWVDWDDNGVFVASEQILNASNVTSATATVAIPAGATQGTPLRLRVMGDLNVTPPLAACNNPLYGQAEDYALIVLANPNPPSPDFAVVPTTTCDGTVQFTDASLNCPTAWSWDFGDGSPLNTDQSPTHTYTTSGTYDVTLIATNAIGSDTLTVVAAVTVDLAGQLIAAACTPTTVNTFSLGYGLLEFTFAGINSSSPDGTESYQDRSCGNTATVMEGTAYPLSALLGGAAGPDMYVWIDFDNNGAFTAAELIHSSFGDFAPAANVTIPIGSVYNVPVRLRVSTDVAGTILGNACTSPQYGQVEDFACIVQQNTNPPVAAFTASPLVTCDGIVTFTDLSTNLPNAWSWDFGDGSPASNAQNPVHTYTTTGLFTVTLTASNPFGSDVEQQVNYIEVIDGTYCDTLWVPDGGGPGGGVDTTTTDCFGVVTDDGGPVNNYTPGTSAAVTIAPPGAQWVTLTFSEFMIDPGVAGGGIGNTPDSLYLFDGPDIFSPVIGWFTGYGVGVLPNGGVITSSGGSITLQQRCTGGAASVDLGFIANWNCSGVGVPELTTTALTIWPQPSEGGLSIAISRPSMVGERIELRDALGRLVLDRAITAGTQRLELDLTGSAAGCYTLSLAGTQGRWTRTIVLN